MDSEKTNKRLGYKTPRSVLLPPYLTVNPYFVQYCDSIDEVLGPAVDAKINAIAHIRNMWVQNANTETKTLNGELIDFSEWTQPERDLLVKQVNMLGMRLRGYTNTQGGTVVADASYQTLARFVGEYWFGKGTQSFIEFINFCLSLDLTLANLWTENYTDFYREGDSHIGTPVWDGGTWYPTTHVELIAKGGLAGVDVPSLQAFFYEIANYNLVLQATTSEFDMYLVDRIEEGHDTAQIVSVGLWAENNMVIANFQGFGAPPPPSHYLPQGSGTGVAYQLPTTYYAPNGALADFNTAFLLAKPSGWMTLPDGKKIPVYGKGYQTAHVGTRIGIELIGNSIPSGQFNLLYGPVTWHAIPGSPKSRARIPCYTTSTFTIEEGEVSVSSATVGTQRSGLLVNPEGFVELSPGLFSPYWL